MRVHAEVADAGMERKDSERQASRRGDLDVPEGDRQVALTVVRAVDAVGSPALRHEGGVANADVEHPFPPVRGDNSDGRCTVRARGHITDAEIGSADTCTIVVDGPGTLARRRDAAAQDLHAERP